MIVEKSGRFISSTQPVCVRARAFLSRRLHCAVDRDGHIEEDRGSAGLGFTVAPLLSCLRGFAGLGLMVAPLLSLRRNAHVRRTNMTCPMNDQFILHR